MPDLRGDLDPGLGEHAREPLAQQRGVVGEDYAHGISAWMRVPAAGRALELEVAVERVQPGRRARAGRSRAGVGAADAVVGDVDHEHAVVADDADADA